MVSQEAGTARESEKARRKGVYRDSGRSEERRAKWTPWLKEGRMNKGNRRNEGGFRVREIEIADIPKEP